MLGRRLLSALLALGLAVACSKQEPPREAPPADARRVDPSKAAKIGGRVNVEGHLPENAPIKMSGDPVCERAHTEGVLTETFVSENSCLGNVFVYVKSGLDKYYFDVPSE